MEILRHFHTMGVVAERYIKEAKERIAKTLKADEKKSFLPQVVQNQIIWH